MQNFDAPQSLVQDPSMWPNDWYVYDNGTVTGPFTASQTFSKQQTTEEGKPVLVSRKGFTQWYALKDLADIFKMTENLGQRVAEEQGFEALRQLAGEQIQSGVSRPTLAPKILKKQVGAPNVAVHIPPPPVQATQMASAIAMPPYRSPAPQTEDVTEAVGTETEAAADSKTERRNEQRAAFQNYFFVRGRLRLGKMRNPWLTSFVGVPLTLGILWPVWMRSFLREVYLHAVNHVKIPSSLVFAAMIPGLHFYAIYKAAMLVRAMEEQNGYKSVSPWLAAAFGICPPVAMAYLQDAANRHWLLHARHTDAG